MKRKDMEHLHITLPGNLLNRLRLLLYSDLELRIPQGALQQFFTARLQEYFTHKQLDLSPWLRSLPGECVVQGDAVTVSRLLSYLKETQNVQPRIAE